MINRILIRIKVIQTLYSFLLVEKQFSIESNPSAPTKEKRFAYSLYLDMLVLLIKLSREVERRRGEYPLAGTRFISRLLMDERVKSLMTRYSSEPFPFDGIVEGLARAVKDSGVYKSFPKDLDRDVPAAEEMVWTNLLNMVVMPSPLLTAVIPDRVNYTMKGVETMQGMLNRTFSNFLASQDNVDEVFRALDKSLDKARELYFRLLMIPVELTAMQERRLDDRRHRHLRTEEDMNPNMRFVENQVARLIRESPAVNAYISKNKVEWMPDDHLLMDTLLKAVVESDIYKEYMAAPSADLHDDCELWRHLFRKVIFPNPVLLETLEEKSVFWNDDIDIMGTFVVKTLRRIEEKEGSDFILDKYKDEEDAAFGRQLLYSVLRNKETYRRYVDEALDGANWDKERLAFMDVVVLISAIGEILNFPKIPLTVSVNEYIELAKCYSTAKSGTFVHGILGTVITRLQKENILHKH